VIALQAASLLLGYPDAELYDRLPLLRDAAARLPDAAAAPWFRSMFSLQPDTALILEAPFGFQLHAQLAWLLIAIWPFTRLVHVFSAPLGYLTRPYVPYRSRGGAQLGLRATRRGWDRVGTGKR
jgi:Nitrate reductase gamma subunit